MLNSGRNSSSSSNTFLFSSYSWSEKAPRVQRMLCSPHNTWKSCQIRLCESWCTHTCSLEKEMVFALLTGYTSSLGFGLQDEQLCYFQGNGLAPVGATGAKVQFKRHRFLIWNEILVWSLSDVKVAVMKLMGSLGLQCWSQSTRVLLLTLMLCWGKLS